MLDHVTIDGDDRVGSVLSIPTQELEAIEKLGSSSRFPNSDKNFCCSWSVELYDTAWKRFESSQVGARLDGGQSRH